MATKRSLGTRRRERSDWFLCVHCKRPVVEVSYGTRHRNHCNWCLWSRHLDNTPGDRASDCQATMEPIAVWARDRGEWAIIHRCRGCGDLRSNRIAGDDDERALVELALRALAHPPFPLEEPLQGRLK